MEKEFSTPSQGCPATGFFEDEQAYLAARVRLGAKRFVRLDPDGTLPPWLAVVIRRGTGVVYATQCAGVGVEQRLVEGYLVLVGGSKFAVDRGRIDLASLTNVFHADSACVWNWKGYGLPPDRLALLSQLIEEIPFWRPSLDRRDSRHQIRIDNASPR